MSASVDALSARFSADARANSKIRAFVQASKDIASVQAGSESMKWATMFYTFFNGIYSRHRILAHDVRTSARDKVLSRNLLSHAWELAMIWLAPALLGEFLSGRAPSFDDDPEDWAKWAAFESLFFAAGMVPGVREAANAVEGALIGQRRSAQFGPLAAVIDQVVRGGKALAAGDVFEQRGAEDIISAVGVATGLPPTQLIITLGYWIDVSQGDENPKHIGEFLRNSAFRRKKKKKKATGI